MYMGVDYRGSNHPSRNTIIAGPGPIHGSQNVNSLRELRLWVTPHHMNTQDTSLKAQAKHASAV